MENKLLTRADVEKSKMFSEAINGDKSCHSYRLADTCLAAMDEVVELGGEIADYEEKERNYETEMSKLKAEVATLRVSLEDCLGLINDCLPTNIKKELLVQKKIEWAREALETKRQEQQATIDKLVEALKSAWTWVPKTMNTLNIHKAIDAALRKAERGTDGK
jgi:chromosome segregation ATPase